MRRQNIEIVMLGDNGTGKTALMRAMDHQPFVENLPITKDPGFLNIPQPTGHDPDPSIPLRVVEVPVHHDPNRGDNIRRRYLGSADAVLICFDTSERASFEDAKSIHRSIQTECPERVQLCFVGTKTDLPKTEHSVSQGEILQYAENTQARYVSCSAKTGQGVEQVFEVAKSQVLESRAPKAAPVVTPSVVEKSKEPVPPKKLINFGKLSFGNKSASEPSEKATKSEESKPDNDRTLEVVLSGIKLSKEQRATFNAVAMHTDAHVLAHAVLLNDNTLTHGSTHGNLESGGKIFARTDRSGNGDKISITVKYSDQNAEQSMKEVADRILKVAVTQQDTLDIRTSHDDAKLLAKALENKNLQPKEAVYRVNIQGMSQDLNKYGPPAFFETEAINKKLNIDPVTKDLKSLEQSVVTPDGKGVMTATANYLPPDQDSKQGARLANQIQVELRPAAGQSLDANTVKAFSAAVEHMRQGGTVQVDVSNPSEFNALLMPQAQAQVQQARAAAEVVVKQAESPSTVQAEKSSRRGSRMPPPISLSRRQSMGELESFSPRENQSDTAKANRKLEKMPTSENVLQQAEQMTDKIFESPRGEVTTSAAQSPMIQRLRSESQSNANSASTVSKQDSGTTPPAPGKK